MGSDNPFGGLLPADPAIALKPLAIPPELSQPGPLHRLHFVVEIVGPRSILSVQAKALLEPTWQGPLGHPSVFVMAPMDTIWRSLTADDPAGSYDSLALAWPYLNPRGSISRQSAQQLLAAAEHFASQVGRRAMPLPPAEDVPVVVSRLIELRENLDVGITLLAVPVAGELVEKEIWVTCAALGLEFASPGVFEWRVPGWDKALLEVAPLEESKTFSLGAVSAGSTHIGVSVGFSIPLSPEPLQVLRAAFAVCTAFEQRHGCMCYDDSHVRLDASNKKTTEEQVKMAAQTLAGAGIRLGSTEAYALFRP